ncbi:YHS domain-containing protein [Pseudodesulfovibrio cashew]|uniref:YHS domain-containing protein n=2 Tax=Pseudodesulfovibrio cashew TaxID=2678688 RepID=A0A6I6JMA7_9BACT|nr:YHS domain-containing protein [Pseudodesulfovibrio cashew]
MLVFFALGTAPLGNHASAQSTEQKLCPVMGFDITRELFTDYKGKRIYFCCPDCPPKFKKSPEKYMKKLLDNGVVPEDAPQA